MTAELLQDHFTADRPRLRSVAYRMLGSLDDAEDAVQQTWLKASRSDVSGVDNLAAWLTTVLSRECLDHLRARRRHEVTSTEAEHLAAFPDEAAASPEREAELADAVGRAMLVVLDRLSPLERVALVLHDMFAVPFEEIAAVVDRTPDTAKKLASRARSKVRGATPLTDELSRQHALAAAFLAAARDGDIPALVAILAPDVTRRAEAALLPTGAPAVLHGVDAVTQEITVLGRRAVFGDVAWIDGRGGVVIAPHGHLQLALRFDYTTGDERVAGYEVIADPARLAALEITLP